MITAELLSHSPYQALAETRSVSPVCWVPDLECWLVTGYNEAVAVMRDPDSFTVDHPGFSTQQVIGPSMLSLDGAVHRLHRDPFSAPFRLQAIRSGMGEWIERTAQELVSVVAPDGQADLRGVLARPLAIETMAHMLGLEGTDPAQLVIWYEVIVDAVHSVTMGSGVTQAGREAFSSLSEAVVASMSTSSLLKTVRADGDLTADEIASNVAVLLFGGIVTGDGTNSQAIQHLLETDGMLARVADRPDLIPSLVDESLRLEPAAAAVDRYATSDVELGGGKVSAGDLVRVSLTAANRDPDVFPDPDTLDITRENRGKHLTFARGPHSCLGIHVARAEAFATIRAVVGNLGDPRLVAEETVAPEGLVFRGLSRVPVAWSQ